MRAVNQTIPHLVVDPQTTSEALLTDVHDLVIMRSCEQPTAPLVVDP
jgi:hypothetical protein